MRAYAAPTAWGICVAKGEEMVWKASSGQPLKEGGRVEGGREEGGRVEGGRVEGGRVRQNQGGGVGPGGRQERAASPRQGGEETKNSITASLPHFV